MSTILDPSIYTIVWIAVLPVEAEAALGMLDKQHTGHFVTSRGEDYLYLPGEINQHNVVIATWPAGQNYGIGSAAALANQIKVKFPKIWFALLVGVAAGLPNLTDKDPTRRRDIRLGDVLVCVPEQTSTGIVQYDLGRDTEQGFFPNSRHGETPPIARAAIGQIRLTRKRPFEKDGEFARTLLEFQNRPGNDLFAFPGQGQDELYVYDYDLLGSTTFAKRATRSVREETELTRVWYGALGSGNSLMRNPRRRDRLRDKHNIIGLEMEAAGVMNTLPTAVIRGVCDYGDETKNKLWQPYAAATAAVYARGILYSIHNPEAYISSLDSNNIRKAFSSHHPVSVGHNTATAATVSGVESKDLKRQGRCSTSAHAGKRSNNRDRSQDDALRELQLQQAALGRSITELQKTLQNELKKTPGRPPRSNNLLGRREVDHRVNTLLSWVQLDELSMLSACEEGLQRRIRRRAILQPHQPKVWNFPIMEEWNRSTSSSILVLNSESTMRGDLVDFCIQAIQVLRQDQIPVIWALGSSMDDQTEDGCHRRVLASFISQIVRLSGFQHRERDFHKICEWLQVAHTEREWLAVLTKLLERLSGVHIILDTKLSACETTMASPTDAWLKLFGKLLERLRSRGCDTVIKIIVLSSDDHIEEISEPVGSRISNLSLMRTSHKTIPISERRSMKAGSRERLPERFALRAGRTTALRR